MRLWLAVGFGGALGSMARHGINVAVSRVAGQPVPYAAATVNVIGCCLIGVLAGWLSSGTIRLGEMGRAFIFVGVIGGFTTFSSLGLDTLTLARGGAVGTAVVNISIQISVGLAGVFAGYWLAR